VSVAVGVNPNGVLPGPNEQPQAGRPLTRQEPMHAEQPSSANRVGGDFSAVQLSASAGVLPLGPKEQAPSNPLVLRGQPSEQLSAGEGKESDKVRLTEADIWLDKAPIPIGHAEKQQTFCKAYPAAALNEKRMAKSIAIVRNVTHALRKSGIPPMIMEGTLLGLYRQGFLINGDHDLDFWIPRHFMSTPHQYEAFVAAMGREGIFCFSAFQQYGAGMKIACGPEGVRDLNKGWKLDESDLKGFYVDISVIDEGTHGCWVAPCSWTQYLTYHNKTYPGVYSHFNWHLGSWHDITLWMPSDPETALEQLYTPSWKNPAGHAARATAGYHFWTDNIPIPDDRRLHYFKNVMNLSAANVLKLQERLEETHAKRIKTDTEKQLMAVQFCAKQEEKMQSSPLVFETHKLGPSL